jgi:hypothetical protein
MRRVALGDFRTTREGWVGHGTEADWAGPLPTSPPRAIAEGSGVPCSQIRVHPTVAESAAQPNTREKADGKRGGCGRLFGIVDAGNCLLFFEMTLENAVRLLGETGRSVNTALGWVGTGTLSPSESWSWARPRNPTKRTSSSTLLGEGHHISTGVTVTEL